MKNNPAQDKKGPNIINIQIFKRGQKKYGYAINNKYKLFLLPTSLLNSLSRHLSSALLRKKTAVNVSYGGRYSNETIMSKNTTYLLETTMMFMEDYLTKTYMKSFSKKIGSKLL